MVQSSTTKRSICVGFIAGTLLLGGCTPKGKFQALSMWNESRLKPYEASPNPAEDSSSRDLPQGTVARGQLQADDAAFTGRNGDNLTDKFPYPITPAVLQRGQERFDIYCSPCHGRAGDGKGMIVKRGFTPPPDYAIPRLRKAPVGHFYDVITHGYGVMYSYGSRVPPNDRWAISAYIRALQASRPVVPEIYSSYKRSLPQRSAPPGPGGTP